LLEVARTKLVRLAQRAGLALKKAYEREGKRRAAAHDSFAASVRRTRNKLYALHVRLSKVGLGRIESGIGTPLRVCLEHGSGVVVASDSAIGVIDMYEIDTATAADVDDITLLLHANSASQDGLLTGTFPRETVAKMALGNMPTIVARREGRVVGVLFSASADDPASPPVIKAMLSAWPGGRGAYVYGPVCVAETERGQGLLDKLYAAQKKRLPGREATLFIRHDNTPSIRAHFRLGMREVARFTLDGRVYLVFSDRATD
jgi:hypothetical protein